jgi:hypothetical protein
VETLADIIVTERRLCIFDNDIFEIERVRGIEQIYVPLGEIKKALLKCKQVKSAEFHTVDVSPVEDLLILEISYY